MKVLRIFSLIVVSGLLFVSCGDDANSEEDLLDYLSRNNINAQSTPSGLYYVIDEPGVDPKPTSSSNVTVHYHGYLLDGTVFDSSVDRGTPLTISLNQVIAGWREGIPLFGTGGSGTLYIPAILGYGNAGSGSIPPNAAIIFEVELISVN